MLASVAAVEAALKPLAPVGEGRLAAVRVQLTGQTPLHDRLAADRDGLAAEDADLPADLDGLCAEAEALLLGRLSGRTC